jgi:hypothetical protein
MKKLIALLGVAAGMAMLSGCAFTGPGLATGGIFSSYTMGSAVGPGSGNKSGEACVMSILGIVALGDGSIEAAKKEGGVTQVAAVDHTTFSILGFYSSTCTKVTGQ